MLTENKVSILKSCPMVLSIEENKTEKMWFW